MSFLHTGVVGSESRIDVPHVTFSKTVNKDIFVGHRWDSPRGRVEDSGMDIQKIMQRINY